MSKSSLVGLLARSWLLLLPLLPSCSLGQFSVTPAKPVVQAGETIRFQASDTVVWSMAPGSQGSIDPDGTYHAPMRVQAKQSLGGCQLLPNNHIFNTRIDHLPVHAKSQLWMAAANTGSVHYLPAFPLNTITSALEPTQMVFAYTAVNNGLFRVPSMPGLKMESGWYTPYFSNYDRHIVAIETDTCIVQEMYNFYPVGANTYNPCPQCNSQSGVRYSNTSYDLPLGATDAAGLFLLPLSLHRDEILAGAVRHALRVTVPASAVSARHVWPAIAHAGWNQNDVMPFGARVRLKSDYQLQTNNPYTQVLLTQLKQYGMIISDIGGAWEIQTADTDLYYDPQILAAFEEIRANVTPAFLEVVDASSLMVSEGSGFTEMDAEVVIATRVSDGATVRIPVALLGVTIGAETQYEVFQAGAPSKQLKAWVRGTANPSIIWTMSPEVGSLTSDGVYTPPSEASNLLQLTITATAAADPAVFTTIQVTILPAGPLRINAGGPAYTDSQGKSWLPHCCTVSKTWDYGTSGWSPHPDLALYKDSAVSYADLDYRFYVPPGNYRIRARFGEASYSSPGVRVMHLESQGLLIYRDVDIYAQVGFKTPVDFELPAVVGPDGFLRFVVRHVRGEQTMLAALEIEPDEGRPFLAVTPSNGGEVRILQQKQFYAVPWYLADQRVTWSLSPPVGSIDSQGLYAAPSLPPPEDVVVTIRATSVADPSLTAAASITVKAGVPAIRVNCGGSQSLDATGAEWSGDYGYSGGVTYGETVPIADTTPDMLPLYRTSRYVYQGERFSYSFKTPNGLYRLRLKWAEYRDTSQGNLMRVVANGQTLLIDFDPVSAAGGVQRAVDRSFEVRVTNGVLRIEFIGSPSSGYVSAAINGIEAVPITIDGMAPDSWNRRISGGGRISGPVR